MLDIRGIHCERKIRESSTGGHYCVLEMHVPPRAGVPPHQHVQQESFFVVEGDAEFARVGADGLEWIAVRPGEAVNVPSWAMHGFRNASERPADILLICAQGIEQFFDRAGVPVGPGAPLPSSPPAEADIQRVLTIAVSTDNDSCRRDPSSTATTVDDP